MSGFIYIWLDRKRFKFYVGSHWGKPGDGYVCGSWRMMKAYRKRPDTFRRRIIAVVMTDRNDLRKEEQRWLDMIADGDLGVRYYNIKKFAIGADPVAASQWMKGNKHGLGKPCSPEKRAKIAAAQIDKFIPFESRMKMSLAKLGTKQAPEHIERRIAPLRNKKRDPAIGRKISAGKMGHTVSIETRAQISASKLIWAAAHPKQPKLIQPMPWETTDVPSTIWWPLKTFGRRPPAKQKLSRQWGAVSIPQTTWRRWKTENPERIISQYIPLGLPI